ncbi:UNVERIFIED_CONTAM: serine/threonine-protein kinase [Acetivibrio alkalicellulosi]
MVGQILGNRYELIEKIGGGGMALVYKAKCNLLNRFVAVKILRSDFINDEEFIKRFRIEAQAAASLSHPNIVSIYDVGHEGDIHYIVMEYVNGVTLKEYLEEKGALEWKEAVNISIQICLAIEHAHKNHIVHRDIKPHNILFTKDGMAKVTDFGIARAVTSSTITMVGSTIGSVHYFSPEQARGGFTDEKSDIYSLGIVLYELLTGKLPFDGDTPVAIALKHIQDEPIEPININDNVPIGVNSIVKKAVQKDQNNRYQTSSELLENLYRVLKEPDVEFYSKDNLKDSPTVRVTAISDKEILMDGNVSKELGDENMRKKKKKKDRFTTVLAVATSIIVISLVVYMGYNVVSQLMSESNKDFIVDAYVGQNFFEVRGKLRENNVGVQENRVYDEEIPKDIIVRQNIGVGESIKPGGFVDIIFDVSNGPLLITIPDLRRKDYREAGIELKGLNIETDLATEHSDTVAIGLVIRTEPDRNQQVKPGDTVTIYRSIGPEKRTTIVPDLIGKTRTEAFNLISNGKLTVGDIYPQDMTGFVDAVTRQIPEAGLEVNELTSVSLYFDEMISTDRKVNRVIHLDNPDNYKQNIRVIINIERSDEDEIEELYNGVKKKDDFPLAVSIPVPKDGSTKVRVYLDRRMYREFEETY